MKFRLISSIMIVCVLLTALPALGVWADSDDGYVFGFVEEATYDEYENAIGLYTVSEGLDDFNMANHYEALPLSATINGTIVTSVDAILELLTPGASVCYRTADVNFGDYWREAIVEIWVDNTPNLTGTYSYSTGTGCFTGLPDTEGMPTLFFNNGWLEPVYLDDNHNYTIQVYDYGILVTAMQATGGREMIRTVRTECSPNEKFLADLTLTATASKKGGVLHAELHDSYGNHLQTKTASLESTRTSVIFTDLPNVSGSFIVKTWITRDGATASPVYEYFYLQEAFDVFSGTILSITPRGTSSLRMELDIGEEWTDTFTLYPPVLVGGVLCETVADLQASPLLTVGSFIRYAGSGNLWVIDDGATSWANYGRINSVVSGADGAEPVLEITMTLPDGSTKVYLADGSAVINDQACASIHEVYTALESGLGGYAGFEVSGEKITKLSYSTDYLDFYDEEYEGKSFHSLPESAKRLPVYYKIGEDEFAEAYLDENHIYDINYYEGFAIEITEMRAKEEGQVVIQRITTEGLPNEDFRQDVVVTCDFEYVGEGQLMVILSDSENDRSWSDYVDVSGTTATVVLSDLPNAEITYELSARLVTADFSFEDLSPHYNKDYQTTTLPIQSGTIFDTSYFETGGWMVLAMESASGVEGTHFSCTSPVYINGYSYTTPDEIGALLKNGQKISYMLDSKGKIGAIQYDEKRDYEYGKIQLGYAYGWEDGEYYIEVTLLMPDLTERKYRMCLESWLNGHKPMDWDDVREVLEDGYGEFSAFVAVGDTITVLKVPDQEDGLGSFLKATYDPTTGTFTHKDLLQYDKSLPIYCCMAPDYEYTKPYLDTNHYYWVDIEEYAIIIKGMEAKDKAATITSIKTSVYPNAEFDYDLGISVNASGTGSGSTLKAQLIDSNNNVLREVGTKGSLSTTLHRVPNREEEYTLRLWLEENGAVISHFYTRPISVPRGTVCYGTLTEDSQMMSSGELQLKMRDAKDSGPTVTVFCTTEDTLSGCRYTSLEQMQGVLGKGAMVRYLVNSQNKVTAIEVIKVMNAITGTIYNEETKQLSANLHLQSTDSEPAIGTIYAGVYSKDGILKQVTTIENQELAPGGMVLTTIRIPNVDYEQGDYVKVHYWTPNHASIAHPSEWDL